jgi:hypothetical protein
MYFAQFSQPSAIDASKIIEACGDRALIILDGRMSRASMDSIAATECQKRGYVAWQLFQGESFFRSQAISVMVKLRKESST